MKKVSLVIIVTQFLIISLLFAKKLQKNDIISQFQQNLVNPDNYVWLDSAVLPHDEVMDIVILKQSEEGWSKLEVHKYLREREREMCATFSGVNR